MKALKLYFPAPFFMSRAEAFLLVMTLLLVAALQHYCPAARELFVPERPAQAPVQAT